MNKPACTWNGKTLNDLSREELIYALELSMAAQDEMARSQLAAYQTAKGTQAVRHPAQLSLVKGKAN